MLRPASTTSGHVTPVDDVMTFYGASGTTRSSQRITRPANEMCVGSVNRVQTTNGGSDAS